jgi:FAD/FMN-containing dehydrogenase
MEHELFRHLELELFVQRKHISNAAHLIAEILKLADDPSHNLSRRAVGWLAEASALETCQSLRGSYSHHYPICFRRVVQDDTLISMASDCPDDCYAVSLITYTLPRDRFYRLVTLIAEVCARLFDARIHWGKWFPLDGKEVARQYPHLSKFREICRRFDPQGVFRNRFICERLGFESDVESPAGGEGGCH